MSHTLTSPARRSRWWLATPVAVATAAIGAAFLFSPSSQAASDSEKNGGARSSRDDGSAFTECVRAHGVDDFPGATIDSDGSLHLKGGNVNVFSSAYSEAVAACADELPEGTSLPGDPSPEAPPAPPAKDDSPPVAPQATMPPQ
jgi:hypothetical protein